MSDLISRSVLIEEIKKRSEYYLEDWDSFRKYTGCRATESYAHFEEDKAIIKIANNLPTVEPVRGEWLNGMMCSNCGQVDWTRPNFCSTCGCDMRKQV